MCRFIKDGGERCGRDSEPFCFQHEDTPQAHFYHSMEELQDDLQEVSAMIEELDSVDLACDECLEGLQEGKRIVHDDHMSHTLVVETYVSCDCGEVVVDQSRLHTSDVPEGWS